MIFDYQAISEDVLKSLPDRTRQIIVRRFGLENDQKETLQAIGGDIGITRERVRQIERASLNKLAREVSRYQPVFEFFLNQLKTTGSLRREDVLFEVLSPELFENQVFFLLSLDNQFNRVVETEDFHTLWTIDRKAMNSARDVVDRVSERLKKVSQPLPAGELQSFSKKELSVILSYLEASKIVQKGPQGLWGLGDWPEINPRGVRDRAHIIFRQEGGPLHFRKVAELINESRAFDSLKKAHPQTVHNELIKDERFVLVGRGLYALREWGYKPGTVKDIIIGILEEAQNPLEKQDVVRRVFEQRLVAKNTILLNLHNKKYFQRLPDGKYTLRN